MGVVFKVCHVCKRTFPDCGEYVSCNENWGGCGRLYCSQDCAELQRPGHDRVPTWREVEDRPEAEFQALVIDCIDCRGQLPNDRNVLDFLLAKTGMTRSEANAAYLESRKK